MDAIEVAGKVVLALLWVGATAYVIAKARSMATKEEVGELTKKVESIRAQIATGEHIRRVRYEDEREYLRQLLDKATRLRGPAVLLRPMLKHGDPAGESTDTRKARLLQPVDLAGSDMSHFIEGTAPFISREVVDAARTLLAECRAEAELFQTADHDFGRDYWESARQHRDAITSAFDALSAAIRARAERFEEPL